MKIYFTTGYENPKKSSNNIRAFIHILKDLEHSFVKRPFKATHGAETYDVNEKEISDIFDFLNRPVKGIFKEAIKRIRNSDVVVAEASYFVSPGVGFEVGYALQEKKPVLVLISKSSDVILSEVLEGNPSDSYHSKRYGSKKEMENIIKNFLDYAAKKIEEYKQRKSDEYMEPSDISRSPRLNYLFTLD